MNKLELAIARKFNKQNPITTLSGMSDEELKANIRYLFLNGWNKFWIISEFTMFKDCSLTDARKAIFEMIGDLVEIFYTGSASTPTSVGVRLKDNRDIVITEHDLSHIKSDVKTRELYKECVENFKKDFGLL
jgi:hypothetical protein